MANVQGFQVVEAATQRPIVCAKRGGQLEPLLFDSQRVANEYAYYLNKRSTLAVTVTAVKCLNLGDIHVSP